MLQNNAIFPLTINMAKHYADIGTSVCNIHTTTFRGICCVVLLLIACNSRNQPITSQDYENRMQLVGQIKCSMMVFTNFLFDLELNRISLNSKTNEFVYGII